MPSAKSPGASSLSSAAARAASSAGESAVASGVPSKKAADKKRASKKQGDKPLSRTKQPAGMSLEQWQLELRRQFGQRQNFTYRNTTDEPIFSTFEVFNPESGRSYRVVIRGEEPGANTCGCGDFQTNNLGVCKHIEFLLDRLRRKRGGKAALRAGFQPAHSEIHLAYGAQRAVRFRPGSECPDDLRRLAGEYFDEAGALRPDAALAFDRLLEACDGLDHEVRVADDALAYIARTRDAHAREAMLEAAFPQGADSPGLGELLSVPLYPYQRQGALFAARAGRCLIGDEMGLGKTIQAIAATEILARHVGVERVLIVCPTSLKHQWEREIARFAPRPTLVVNGLQAARRKAWAAESFYKITNYDTVHADLEAIQRWAPDLVVLDEAQRIKNWNTRAARAVKRLESPHAIVLTGTPLENRLEELVSIVQFVDLHRLGPTYQFLHRHQQRAEGSGQVVGYRDLDQIAETLRPILLRRRKVEVLGDLPPRLEKKLFVPLTPPQAELHAENKDIVARLVAKWRRFGFLTEQDQRNLLQALQRMRMCCDSTYLLDETSDHNHKIPELDLILEELLEERNAKVVVFSQWLRMHELIRRRLERRAAEHVLFHGGLSHNQRKECVRRFREDDRCRVFLATDAGGVGLNLQFAQAVVNVDLPWNPAVLEQRIGRVHRLGQTRPVQVVNLIAEGSIEHGMLSLLDFKQALFSGVLDGGEKNVFLGGGRMKKFIETVEKATTGIPDATPEPAAASEAGAEDRQDEDRQDEDRRDEDASARPEARRSRETGGTSETGDASDARSRPRTDESPEADAPAPGAERHAPAPTATPAPRRPATTITHPAGGVPAGEGLATALQGLFINGMALLEQLAAASAQATPGDSAHPGARAHTGAGDAPSSQHAAGQPSSPGGDASTSAVRVLRDETDGGLYLRAKLPDPQFLHNLLQGFAKLLGKE